MTVFERFRDYWTGSWPKLVFLGIADSKEK
jgi:hypothetical protein